MSRWRWDRQASSVWGDSVRRGAESGSLRFDPPKQIAASESFSAGAGPSGNALPRRGWKPGTSQIHPDLLPEISDPTVHITFFTSLMAALGALGI
jgi:hypothetical protein